MPRPQINQFSEMGPIGNAFHITVPFCGIHEIPSMGVVNFINFEEKNFLNVCLVLIPICPGSENQGMDTLK